MQGGTAFAHFIAGRDEQALSWAERALGMKQHGVARNHGGQQRPQWKEGEGTRSTRSLARSQPDAAPIRRKALGPLLPAPRFGKA